jgi:hypothetical protein
MVIESSMFRVACIAFVSLISASCASTSEVVPIGNGSYEIAGSSATALSSGGSEKVKLIKVANQYCGAQGKQAAIVNAESTNGRVGSGAFASGSAYGPGSGANFNATAVHPGTRANADVIFQCQ